jgi:hypothetical protein
MFLTFPEDAHWNAERQAIEFGVEIGEYRGMVPGSAARVPMPPTGSAHARALRRGDYLQRTRFESIAER